MARPPKSGTRSPLSTARSDLQAAKKDIRAGRETVRDAAAELEAARARLEAAQKATQPGKVKYLSRLIRGLEAGKTRQQARGHGAPSGKSEWQTRRESEERRGIIRTRNVREGARQTVPPPLRPSQIGAPGQGLTRQQWASASAWFRKKSLNASSADDLEGARDTFRAWVEQIGASRFTNFRQTVARWSRDFKRGHISGGRRRLDEFFADLQAEFDMPDDLYWLAYYH